MNRAPLSLAAGIAALAVTAGLATFTKPAAPDAAAAGAAARLPVERSTLLCPAPSGSDLAETAYTSITPLGGDGAKGKPRAGRATLLPAPDGSTGEPQKSKTKAAPKAVVTLTEPGKPAAGTATGAEAPALVGAAEGGLAPGWAAQQTTVISAGTTRGVLGISCTPPDTEFWFPGTSTAKSRQDYLHITNPDDSPAVVDVELYGPEGVIKSESGEGIPVPAMSSVPVLLSTLTSSPVADLTVHVSTRSGRVGAAVQAREEGVGADWLPASATPSNSLVLPGIPADATSVRLIAFAPGETDADLTLKLAGPSSSFTPAEAEDLHIKAGMTATADLKDVTRGEAGSLLLTPTNPRQPTPVVAALRITRGSGAKQELAFVPAASPVGERATAADNRSAGSTLSLTATRADSTVRVTASAGTGGGTAVSKTYTIKAGTTQAVEPPVPSGLKGAYALTVETTGGGPVYAARTLEVPTEGIPMFTVQTLLDDRGTVTVPKAVEELSVLDE
ncbi:DUF5719 family protein [Streptomyces sp. NPDC006879]|uniref:DUF5719 family protein n=1 Tax=Streptomyces sp. NPDC006879 TaxID=3364767 RepID=UPI0036AB4521